ncbi:MAG: substrate-binding domain-containing protein [Rhodospirillales bacterium]|nr:substrate-binding domain-containing protein [Rhodospirillales bacterium]
MMLFKPFFYFRFLFLAGLMLVLTGAGAWFGAPAAEKTFVVGFPQDNMANEWRAAQVWDVQKELAKHPNIRFIHSDAQGQTAKNIQDLEDMVDQGLDLLIISPRNRDAMSPVIAALHKRGIPVILLTRQVSGEGYTTFISADDSAIAHQAAKYLAGKMGGKGRILVLQGVPTATTAVHRTKGFLDAMKDFPGITIAAIRPASYLRANAIKVVDEAIEEGLEFDAIYAQSDGMAAGARLALKAAGRDTKRIPIIGIDYIPEARTAIMGGEQIASFTYPTCGKEGAQAAVRLLRGQSVPRKIEVPSIMVTPDNVHTIPTNF